MDEVKHLVCTTNSRDKVQKKLLAARSRLIGPLQGGVNENSPGFVAVISREAAHKYVTKEFLRNSLIQSHLRRIQFPAVPPKGHLEHWIRELHVVRVFVPDFQMELGNEVGFQIVRARLHLSAKFFFGKHFERIDIFVDVNIRVEARFFNYVLDSVDLSFGHCHSSFKIVRITSSSHLQAAKAKPIVNSILAASLPNLLCETLQRLMKFMIFDYLYTTDAYYHMGPAASIHYQLASKPSIHPAYFIFEMRMILRTQNHILTIPFNPSPIPLPSLKDERSMSLGLTQDSLNMILGVLLQIPNQELISTKEVFSGAVELTSVITGLFAHQKCLKCPVMSSLKVGITLVGTKRVTLQPNLIMLHLSVQISILSMGHSGAPYNLFVLKANLALELSATAHDNKLRFSPIITSLDLVLVSSEHGPIEVSGLAKWIKLLLKETYLPHINDRLNIGIPLPSILHVRVQYPVIQVIQGMIVFCL
ncbi:BPI fold-containing family B member 3-like [Erythrolamprus reginae]|uniref:BPI fold-containing family B member 3-like n=1 Tax=Erythrolamprus reginae TaxID=121349 RepID=UPI00396CD510